MKIISEKTGLEYSSVDECIKAEKAYDEKLKAKQEAEQKALAEKQAKAEKLAKVRKERAAEVEKAYKASVEAAKYYQDIFSQFVKDYGNFHMTIHAGDLNPFDGFNFFNNCWF